MGTKLKKHVLLFAGAWLFVMLSLVAASPRSVQAKSGRQVWAYYMGFWSGGPSWDMQANVLTDYPSIGKYDSRDPGVAGTQIDQAQSAGIDAFVVSWFGVGEQVTTTPSLRNLLDQAAPRGFEVGAVIDVFNPVFNRNWDEIAASVNYLVNDLSNHPAYLRYNGKPVIMFAFQGNVGLSSADWVAMRNQIDPQRRTIWIAEGVDGCCLYGGAMDGMYAFNIAWADGSSARFLRERNAVLNNGGSIYLPTVHPGWDESLIAQRDNRPNPTSPRSRAGGQFLTNSWNGAVSAGTDVILIGTWNEFIENSHIEPSQQYGTQSLDVLRPLIAAWESGGGSVPVPAVPVPTPTVVGGTGQAAEATTVVNVRSGAGIGWTRIGTIFPGTSYPVLGEESGWYNIDLNGRSGWVWGELVTIRAGGAPVQAGVPMLEATTVVNVRSGPSTEWGRIGAIFPGAAYPVTGEQFGWYSFDYNGRTGWVLGTLVNVSSTGGAVAAPPPQINFTADATSIDRGDCTYLRWETEYIASVYLNGEGVVGDSGRQVCPSSTRAYELSVVLLDGSTTTRSITISVD